MPIQKQSSNNKIFYNHLNNLDEIQINLIKIMDSIDPNTHLDQKDALHRVIQAIRNIKT